MSRDLVIVTAASSNHAGALRQMLESLRRLGARVECYDLGLTPDELRALPRWDGLVCRRFEYERYPSFMNVEVHAGEYAWKPVIVADVIDRVRAAGDLRDVLWADAGCYFHTLTTIASRIEESRGLWVRASAGTMRQWTHPGTFRFFNADLEEYGEKRNADATLIGFAIGSGSSPEREAVYRDVVVPWKTCAMVRECIAPHGSSRANHRQDQAVLTYLIHRCGYTLVDDNRRELGIRCKCDRWFYHYIGFDVPAGLYARTCLG